MREITPDEQRELAGRIGDVFLLAGHPLTCNGGNPDLRGHHDHEVRLQLDDDDQLHCPECGRVQQLPAA